LPLLGSVRPTSNISGKDCRDPRDALGSLRPPGADIDAYHRERGGAEREQERNLDVVQSGSDSISRDGVRTEQTDSAGDQDDG
jgi:hypothetical protein